MAVWRLQVNTGGANVADYCLQNHVAALWAGKVLAYLMGNYYDSKATYEKLFDWNASSIPHRSVTMTTLALSLTPSAEEPRHIPVGMNRILH